MRIRHAHLIQTARARTKSKEVDETFQFLPPPPLCRRLHNVNTKTKQCEYILEYLAVKAAPAEWILHKTEGEF